MLTDLTVKRARLRGVVAELNALYDAFYAEVNAGATSCMADAGYWEPIQKLSAERDILGAEIMATM